MSIFLLFRSSFSLVSLSPFTHPHPSGHPSRRWVLPPEKMWRERGPQHAQRINVDVTFIRFVDTTLMGTWANSLMDSGSALKGHSPLHI